MCYLIRGFPPTIIDPSDVSRLVDKLLAKGFVERTENTDDRRQKNIVITSFTIR
ncbi:MAG: MarR family transcriptional regulator [Mariniphaga sp.]